jgi:hypothetical protein
MQNGGYGRNHTHIHRFFSKDKNTTYKLNRFVFDGKITANHYSDKGLKLIKVPEPIRRLPTT